MKVCAVRPLMHWYRVVAYCPVPASNDQFFATEIERGSVIKDSVILPKVSIGKNCRITRTIIDKACTIEDGTIIGEDLELDRKRFHVTESGIVLVTPEMLGQHLYVVDKDMLAKVDPSKESPTAA